MGQSELVLHSTQLNGSALAWIEASWQTLPVGQSEFCAHCTHWLA
jgi:hypothetical protein